eukprot:234-Pelagococcus_subviridis.AAC.3
MADGDSTRFASRSVATGFARVPRRILRAVPRVPSRDALSVSLRNDGRHRARRFSRISRARTSVRSVVSFIISIDPRSRIYPSYLNPPPPPPPPPPPSPPRTGPRELPPRGVPSEPARPTRAHARRPARAADETPGARRG